MLPRFPILPLLAVAAAGPYLASETEFGRSLMAKLTGKANGSYLASTSLDGQPNGYANHSHHEVEQLRGPDPSRYRYEAPMVAKLGGSPAASSAAAQLVGTPVTDLREVLRFDISPDWVISRFSRVSTVLSDLQLEGLRVPIVTGTQADDLAGTLTFYFDRSDKLQRLTLHGFTGDPTRIATNMTQHYGLIHEPSLEAGVYTKRWNGLPTHFLRLTHAPVVYSDAVHNKYTLFLELNDPNLAYGISREARRIVSSDRQTGRW